jgi:DNA transformation protein and related proteins
MTSDAQFVAFVIEQMEGAGVVRARKMFGEYGVYCDEKIVGLICDDRLYVKPTEAGRSYMGEVEEAPPYPGAKSYFVVGDRLDDPDWLVGLIRASFDELPAPKPKKRKKKR